MKRTPSPEDSYRTSSAGRENRTRRRPEITATACAAAMILCLCGFPALADGTPPVSVSVRALFGGLYGTANEYVYNQDRLEDYMNSQLVWALQPLFFSGASLSLDTSVGIFAELEVRQGFPGSAGTMTDSDFLNGDGMRTHFSQSDSIAERATLLDLRAGWDFYRREVVGIGAFAAFSYMDLKWSARDGYLQYPTSGTIYTLSPFTPGTYTPWSASETKTPLYGTGILYETSYVGGSVGARARVSFFPTLSMEASFAFTPLLTCTTLDDHVDRQVDFSSTLSGGFMIEPRAAVSFTFVPGATLRLDLGYRSAWGLKGDLKQVNTGSSDFSTAFPYVAGPDSAITGTNDSGADFGALDASLGLDISL